MPNLAALLKSEISRLAKKEVRKEVLPLRKVAVGYRREIAQLKRTLASLQRTTKQLAKPRSSSDVSVSAERPVRFVAKGLVSLRRRLGLSAEQMARLLGVSMQSVYNWEHKKASPRKEQLAAIVALRSAGKKAARERLDAIRPSKVRRATPKAARPRAARKRTRRTRTAAKA